MLPTWPSIPRPRNRLSHVLSCNRCWFRHRGKWNIDGSFPHPKLATLVLGVFWSFWVLLSLQTIVAYFRERLFVTPDAIIQHGCIRKKTINITNVVQLVWRRFLLGGSVIVRSHFSRIKIHFSNFTTDEQDQLIACLRRTISPRIQEDWMRFTEARRQLISNRTPKKSRATAAICALLLFSFAGIVGYC